MTSETKVTIVLLYKIDVTVLQTNQRSVDDIEYNKSQAMRTVSELWTTYPP